MADPIFERYKEALRAGHVAALRGRLDDALVQYRAAAAIAPERPLPHVGIADVLLRMGRHQEALAACEAALTRGPGDAGAVELEARIHEAAGDSGAAAATLDRLAGLLTDADRPDAALAAATRARDLASSPERVRRVEDLERAWLASGGTLPLATLGTVSASVATGRAAAPAPGAGPVPEVRPAPADATVAARVEPEEAPAPEAMAPEAPGAADSPGASEAPGAVGIPEVAREPASDSSAAAVHTPEALEAAAEPERPAEAEPGASAEPEAGASAGLEPGASAAHELPAEPGILAGPGLPARPGVAAETGAPEAMPGPDAEGRPTGAATRAASGSKAGVTPAFEDVAAAEELSVAAERQSASGDPAGAARLHVRAADAYLAIGATAAAFEECLLALAAAPGETDVHLALARIHAASGRRDRTEATIGSLERLLALDGDEEGLARAAAARRGMR